MNNKIKRKASLKGALLALLAQDGEEHSLRAISRKLTMFYPATAFQEQPDPKYPYATRIEHATRKALSVLVAEGLVIRTRRGHYRIREELQGALIGRVWHTH